jgi:hypothetical protein
MHLDEEQLQRVLHGELGNREAAAREHLETCPECRYRVSEAKREESWVFDRLHRLDHATPKVSAQVMSRSRGGASYRQRLAAGIFLAVVAAGAAYAIPGSPLPRVVSRIIQAVSGGPSHQPPILVTPSLPPAAEAGIVVAAGQRLLIVFPRVQSGGEATVSLTEGPDVVVRAPDGAAFTSDVDRLSIDSVRPGSRFEIQIPRTALLVEIRAGGRRLFLKRLSRVVTDAHPDDEGHYRLPLSGSP